jgi:hypothetical protein
MIIEISMQPMFWLGLLRRDVDTLMKLAEHHYDGACRMAGKPGNFLYGWFNITREQSECGDYKETDVPKCSGSRRQLDTVLKICEGTRLAFSARILTREEMERMDTLCATIMSALEVATLACQATQLDPVTEPSARGKLLWSTNPGRM